MPREYQKPEYYWDEKQRVMIHAATGVRVVNEPKIERIFTMTRDRYWDFYTCCMFVLMFLGGMEAGAYFRHALGKILHWLVIIAICVLSNCAMQPTAEEAKCQVNGGRIVQQVGDHNRAVGERCI